MFRFAPKRDPDERKSDIKVALWTLAICIVLTLASWAYILLPSDGSERGSFGIILLVVAFAAPLGVLQALFELFVAATIGTERLIALMVIALAALIFATGIYWVIGLLFGG